jgi:hypothetical protein
MLWIMIVAGLLFFFGAAVAENQEQGPESMKVDTNGKGRSVSSFPHRSHQDLLKGKTGCVSCHHDMKGGNPPRKCGTCHTDPKKKDPLSKASGFRYAFHKACMGCHMDQKDQPDLKKCATCHEK